MAQSSILELATAINELSKNTPEPELAKSVAAYIIAERRTAELDKIMRQVLKLRQSQGKNEITLTSAFPVDDTVVVNVKKLIKNEQAVVNKVIDKSVIGGVRIQSNDFYLDLTVRNRLNKLKVGVN